MKLREPFGYAQQIAHQRCFHAFESIATRAEREQGPSRRHEAKQCSGVRRPASRREQRG
jgi:hypothetical protein